MNYQEYKQYINQKLSEKVQRELADSRENILIASYAHFHDVSFKRLKLFGWTHIIIND